MSTMPSPVAAAPARSLEGRISELRDELFDLVEAARETAAYDLTALHVSLQAACNELGKAERAARDG